MAPSPIWKPSPNFWSGRLHGLPTDLVLHTMDGSLTSTDSWFANAASQVSAHYGVGLDGAIHQYVHLEDSAWANGVLEAGNTWGGPVGVNPNHLTVSIETEDLRDNDRTVTEAQYVSTLACARIALARYPSIARLRSHRSISPLSRPHCPGRRWIESGRMAALGDALGLEVVA